MVVLNNNDRKKVKYKLYQIGSDNIKKLQRNEKIDSHNQKVINTFDGEAILHVYSRNFTMLISKILLCFFGILVLLYSLINKHFYLYSVSLFNAPGDLEEFVIDINHDTEVSSNKDMKVIYKSYKALIPYAIINGVLLHILLIVLIIVLNK